MYLSADVWTIICEHMNVLDISNLLSTSKYILYALRSNDIVIEKSSRTHHRVDITVKMRKINRFNIIENRIYKNNKIIYVTPHTHDNFIPIFISGASRVYIYDTWHIVFVNNNLRGCVIISAIYHPSYRNNPVISAFVFKIHMDIFHMIDTFQHLWDRQPGSHKTPDIFGVRNEETENHIEQLMNIYKQLDHWERACYNPNLLALIQNL